MRTKSMLLITNSALQLVCKKKENYSVVKSFLDNPHLLLVTSPVSSLPKKGLITTWCTTCHFWPSSFHRIEADVTTIANDRIFLSSLIEYTNKYLAVCDTYTQGLTSKVVFPSFFSSYSLIPIIINGLFSPYVIALFLVFYCFLPFSFFRLTSNEPHCVSTFF
jgi:hypothetical protein